MTNLLEEVVLIPEVFYLNNISKALQNHELTVSYNFHDERAVYCVRSNLGSSGVCKC